MLRKQKEWRSQFHRISEILRTSLSDSQQYCRPVFEQEEASISKFSKNFQQRLMATKQVILEIDFKRIFAQLRKKLEGLGKLLFEKDLTTKSLNFKHKRLQRFLRLAKTEAAQIPLKISTQKIKQILQSQSKLNMNPELFILKCYLSQNLQNQKYSYEQDPLQLTEEECFEKVTLKFKIIHTYRPGQAEKIISSSIPSLQQYKNNYYSLVNSEELNYFKGQHNQFEEDEEEACKKCCAYLKYSMRLDFFNSLVKEEDTKKYIQRFSIIENKAICQGLIVGALWGIPKAQEPDFSDSEEEQSWEDKKQNLIAQFCTLFQGYFEVQDDNKQLNEVITRMALLQQHNRKDFFETVDEYWLKA